MKAIFFAFIIYFQNIQASECYQNNLLSSHRGLLGTKGPFIGRPKGFSEDYQVVDGPIPIELNSIIKNLNENVEVRAVKTISFDSIAPEPGKIGRTIVKNDYPILEILPNDNSPLNRFIKRATDQTGQTRVFIASEKYEQKFMTGELGFYDNLYNIIVLSPDVLKKELTDGHVLYHELRHAFLKARRDQGVDSVYNGSIKAAHNSKIENLEDFGSYTKRISLEESHTFMEDSRRFYRRLRTHIRNQDEFTDDLLREGIQISRDGENISFALFKRLETLKSDINIDEINYLANQRQLELNLKGETFSITTTDDIHNKLINFLSDKKDSASRQSLTSAIQKRIGEMTNQISEDRLYNRIVNETISSLKTSPGAQGEFYFNVFDSAFTPGVRMNASDTPFIKEVQQKYPEMSSYEAQTQLSTVLSLGDKSTVKNADGTTSIIYKFPDDDEVGEADDLFDNDFFEDDIPITLILEESGKIKEIIVQ